MNRIPAFVLASIRLTLFAAYTVRELVGLLIGSALGGEKSEKILSRGRRWGNRLTTLFGVRVECRGSVPDGPVLFVANHRSYVDIPALLSISPSFFLAKTEVGEWPLIGQAARIARAIFVRREDRESRKRAKEAIRRRVEEGYPVTVFVEGTTHQGPGALPFRPGVFYMAAAAGLAIVPIALQYEKRDVAWIENDTLLRHFFACFGRRSQTLFLHIGPEFRHADGARLKEEVEGWVRDRLFEFHLRKGETYEPTTILPVRVPLPAVPVLK